MKISKDIEKQIIEFIKQGESLTKISEKTSVSRRTIKNVGVRNGLIELKENERLNKAYEMWKQGNSIESISKELKMYKGDISLYIKQKGEHVLNPAQKNTYNENVFKKIDNEESAYWLGFITADGCIVERKKNGRVKSMTLEIGLALKDIKHLEKFCKFIGISKSEIRFKKSYLKATDKYYDVCRVGVYNTEICRDLIELGVTPRKSGTAEFCPFIPKELLVHYLRGCVDGDGYFRKQKKTYSLEILASRSFINTVVELFEINSYRVSKKTENTNTFTLSINSKESKELLEKMYINSNIYLDRKYDKAIAVLNRNI